MNGYRIVLGFTWILYFCVSAFATEPSLFQDGDFEKAEQDGIYPNHSGT